MTPTQPSGVGWHPARVWQPRHSGPDRICGRLTIGRGSPCLTIPLTFAAIVLASCGGGQAPPADAQTTASSEVSVGVVKVSRKTLTTTLTLSSELVPFQEIDVYAKESGYVKELNVDYGTRVQANQTLATLEIPELQSQLKQDDAASKNASDQIAYAQNELSRTEAQHKVLQLQFERLSGVSKSKPGLVAQQEVDDSEGKALASAAQVESARSNLQSAQSLLAAAQARREHDQVLFDYTKITAPFAGIVTQRYANFGTLLQAGTNSSTQALPLVKLSEDDKFRLVIPVPESYVRFIHIGDPVGVMVPALNRTFPGTVSRFSVDVTQDTRTMHTEVDVLNPNRLLLPGLYAQATIALEKKNNAVAVPLQALNQGTNRATVDVVDSSGNIEIRQVVAGIQTDTDAEIVSGLKEGEMVVVSDRSSLKSGQIVRPQVTELMQYHGQEDRK
jgi:RND family efflux transporter MFP subunit